MLGQRQDIPNQERSKGKGGEEVILLAHVQKTLFY